LTKNLQLRIQIILDFIELNEPLKSIINKIDKSASHYLQRIPLTRIDNYFPWIPKNKRHLKRAYLANNEEAIIVFTKPKGKPNIIDIIIEFFNDKLNLTEIKERRKKIFKILDQYIEKWQSDTLLYGKTKYEVEIKKISPLDIINIISPPMVIIGLFLIQLWFFEILSIEILFNFLYLSILAIIIFITMKISNKKEKNYMCKVPLEDWKS